MSVLVPQPLGIPLPEPTPISRPYWEGCARGELLFQRCTTCGRAIFNPSPVCRWCNGRELAWEPSDGVGSVYSWSVVWRPQAPAFVTPYVPAILDLDEGYQMVSAIIGCEPEEVHDAMRVVVEFHPIGDDMLLPYFRPVAAPQGPS